MKAKITAKLEISDHDGYCSGNECEYEISIIEKTIDTPLQYKNYQLGEIENIDLNYWIKFLDPPELNESGSYYCGNSDKCIHHGLELHDYKYTIMKVELIDDDVINCNLIEKLDMRIIFED